MVRRGEKIFGFVAIVVGVAIVVVAVTGLVTTPFLVILASLGVAGAAAHWIVRQHARSSAQRTRKPSAGNSPTVPERDTFLAHIPARRRVAFAAACCERLLPAYERFVAQAGWGDLAPLCEAIALAWCAAAGDEIDKERKHELAKRCEEVVPDIDHRFASNFAAPAQNAAIAAIRTLECIADPTRAATVGDLALDAVEAYVDLAFGEGPTYDAAAVAAHRAVRREQYDQELTLHRLGQGDIDRDLLDELRAQASRSGFAILGQPGPR